MVRQFFPGTSKEFNLFLSLFYFVFKFFFCEGQFSLLQKLRTTTAIALKGLPDMLGFVKNRPRPPF